MLWRLWHVIFLRGGSSVSQHHYTLKMCKPVCVKLCFTNVGRTIASGHRWNLPHTSRSIWMSRQRRTDAGSVHEGRVLSLWHPFGLVAIRHQAGHKENCLLIRSKTPVSIYKETHDHNSAEEDRSAGVRLAGMKGKFIVARLRSNAAKRAGITLQRNGPGVMLVKYLVGLRRIYCSCLETYLSH